MPRAALRLSLAALTALASIAVAAPVSAAASSTSDSGGTGWLPATPSAWDQVVDASSTPPVTVTRGVTVRSDTLDTVSGRQHTQVMDVDLTDPNVRLGTVEAGNVLTDPADETVGSMAARTHAVAGINGDYFDINATGRPLGGVISNGALLKSPRPNYNAQLGVRADGSMVIGPQTYTGSVADGPATHALTSVNVVDDVPAGGVTRITPALGATAVTGPATLVLGHRSGADLVVDSVQTGVTAVPALTAPTEGLLGGGAGGDWLATTVHAGDTLTIAEKIGPDGDLTQLLSGATELVRDGKPYTDPTGTPPGGVNPETAVGVTADGRHAILVTLDGRLGESTATGVSPAQVAGYLIARGAYTAVLLDGGGSTEMVAREPGATTDSVLNTPSDGQERPVANGLFVYGTATAAGPARTVTVNGAAPVTTVPGGTVDVPVTAVDALGDPATGTTTVSVQPPGLATWANGELTVRRSGLGRIVARNGTAVATEPLRVVDRLSALSVSPATADLGNGATQRLALTGRTAPGQAASVLDAHRQPADVDIPAGAAHWSVNPPALGTVDADGLFTAAAQGTGMATVTAGVGGRTTTASIAVGSNGVTVADLSDVDDWKLRNTTGDPASLSLDPSLPPGVTAPGSLRLDYTMPAGTGVKQLVLSSSKPISIAADSTGRLPEGIGLWVSGDGAGLTLHEQYIQVNGQALALAETTVTWQGWRLYTAALPAGVRFPLSLSYIDFLAVSPGTTTTGTLAVSDLQALYSPRPVTTTPYVPVPANPSWLRYGTDPAAPGPGALLTGGAAAVGAPGSAGAAVLAALPHTATAAQFLGDMSADGTPTALATAKSAMAGTGVPFHDAVGATETSGGALPENGDFAAAFGATHYAYPAGSAQVIVTDSAHGGLLASDPSGSPAEAQYPWLAAQLSADTAPVVVLATELPAYDPYGGTSGFQDAWEARMYVRLIQRYQQTHPDRHVLMLSGGAGGYAETVIDPLGDPGPGGIPQFTVGDLGAPTTVPAARGGYPAYALLRPAADGTVRYTVDPVLAALTITVPQPGPHPGTGQTLTALGTPVGATTPAVPITDPMARTWTSSAPAVATIDPATGHLTAHHPGTTTITLRTATQSTTTTLTVTP